MCTLSPANILSNEPSKTTASLQINLASSILPPQQTLAARFPPHKYLVLEAVVEEQHRALSPPPRRFAAHAQLAGTRRFGRHEQAEVRGEPQVGGRAVGRDASARREEAENDL